MAKNQKARMPSKPLRFRVDPDEPLMLILPNGLRIKQRGGLDLFLSKNGSVYSLTRYGLRPRRINYTRKRRYGKPSRNGVPNGRRYPYVTFRGGTYAIHVLMMDIWTRPRRGDEEIDHLDGNIDNFRLSNLEIVTRQENHRRSRILRAMRKAAQDLNDPSLAPENKSPEELLKIFSREVTENTNKELL